MPYTVTLEHGSDGGYMAWVHELPGCFARGATRAEVEAKLGPAIEGFLAWLRSNGEPVPDGPVAFAVAAEVETPEEGARAGSDNLLEPDRAPIAADDWARLERWLSFSRRDALDALRRTPHEVFDRKPEGAPRSIHEHLQHVAFVEFMYAVWTFDLRSREGLAEFLAWTRGIAVRRMRDLARRGDARETVADWSGAPRLEPWTARKAARRLLWHERLHLRAVERLLARAAR